MSGPALVSIEQESVPPRLTLHATITQSTGRTHISTGGESSIKKPNSEPRQNCTSIPTSDSSSSKLKVKSRSSYHRNENGSPVSNPYTSNPQIRIAARKSKVEFDIDFNSIENGSEVVKRRHKYHDYH